MKKTLLAVALLVASTSVFAQVNRSDDNKLSDRRAVQPNREVNTLLSKKAKKNPTKDYAEGTNLLCDFSNPSAYKFGTMSNHTTPGAKGQWQLKEDTMSLFTGQTTDPNMKDYSINEWFSLSTPGNWTAWFQNRANMSAWNGFAYVDFLAIWLVDGKATTNFNAYVQFTEPIFTAGLKGVDIYLNQICYRFNSDQYFIDWSHTEDFAVYDSIEFDVRGVDVQVNSSLRGPLVVNLPSGTSHCEIISEDESEPTYIRIRVSAPAAAAPGAGDDYGQPQGYFYMLDDVSWAEAPARRLDIKTYTWYNAYTMIPEIINADDLYMQAIVENTGGETLSDIVLSNNMVYNEYTTGKAEDGETDSSWYVKVPTGVANASDGSLIIVTNDGTEETEETITELTNKVRTAISYTNGTPTDSTVDRKAYIIASNEHQTTSKGVGYYSLQNELSYKSVADPTWDTVVSLGNNAYWALSSYDTVENNYRWSRAYGDAYGYSSVAVFRSGRTKDANGTVWLTSRAAYTKAGYKVCLAYSTSSLDGEVYAKGVEVTPAPGFSKQNTKIKGSLWYWTGSADMATRVMPVTKDDDEDVLIQSNVYTVTADDINTTDNMDEYYRVLNRDLNKIYLPFTNTSLLEDSVQYYACYELAANGTFGVANDYPYADVYGVGSVWNCLVASGLEEDYAWGWPIGTSVDYVPMIRLIVGTDGAPSGIENVQVASSDMALYPNPATNNTVLSYTLNNSGNVTLTITDLTGRVVMTRAEGMQNAGITYKANINVKDMANGTYFCTINVNGVKSTSKLIVNK